MAGNVVQVVGLVAVLVALYFSAMQTRKLQKQLNLTNLFNRYEALNHASERYDAGLAMLFERPELRPYAFDRKPLDLDGADLARALIVADQMAGAVDHALRVGERFPDDLAGDWTPVAESMAQSPLFRAIVHEKRPEFPDLARFFPPEAEPDPPALASIA
ncbi:hypothetical protein [Actinoplanes sp. NPDC026619]|uniref:hypothetical protein n=1 Tax=Actinoplanes sp. NPDC026619 TaxID=3155798 RepID=UPI0033CE35D9